MYISLQLYITILFWEPQQLRAMNDLQDSITCNTALIELSDRILGEFFLKEAKVADRGNHVDKNLWFPDAGLKG